MDERRGLKGVTFIFPGHVAARQTVEFLVHQRGKVFQRGLIPSSPGSKQLGDVGRTISIGGHWSEQLRERGGLPERQATTGAGQVPAIFPRGLLAPVLIFIFLRIVPVLYRVFRYSKQKHKSAEGRVAKRTRGEELERGQYGKT